MQPREQPYLLEQAIADLYENKPEFKELSLTSILNPVAGVGNEQSISWIGDEELLQLGDALKQNKTLEGICIDWDENKHELGWTPAGAKAFGDSIKNHPTLHTVTIDLETYDLTDDHILGFFSCLLGTANIQHLYITTYSYSAYFLNTLGKLLTQKTSLKLFYLQNRSFHNSQEEKTSLPLADFAAGLGAQSSLQVLSIKYLYLGNGRIDAIAEAMQRTLKQLELVWCGINNANTICSIAIANKQLQKLDISHNPLTELGIKQLANTLPFLSSLKTLILSKTGLNNTALAYLTKIYREKKLTFSRLDLSSNPLDIHSMDSLIKLIDGNKHLKRLDLRFCRMYDAMFQRLIPLLSDSKRCQLEHLHVVDNTSSLSNNMYKQLPTIVKKNEYLQVHTNHIETMLDFANNLNERKKHARAWMEYVGIILCLFNAYELNTASVALPKLSSMPMDILRTILTFIAPNTPHTAPQSTELCFTLMEQNIMERRSLTCMSQPKKRPPTQPKLTWWSHSITDDKKNMHVLFLPAQQKTITTMSADESLKEAKRILAFTNEAKAEEQRIILRLPAAYSISQRIEIRNFFTRLFEIMRYFADETPPVADIHSVTGNLVIEHITVTRLQSKINDMSQKISRCTIM